MNLGSLSSRRAWVIGCAVVAVLIVAITWFVVMLPKLSTAASTRADARDNDVANTQLAARHGALVREERGIATLRANLTTALEALPPTSALPEFTHEATGTATKTSVTLQNINIGSLTPVTPTSTPATTPSASTSSSTPTSPASTSPASAGATATATAYQLSITLTTLGPVKNQLAFLKAIENGPRRALVTSTSFSGVGKALTLSTQLNIFTAPMTDQQVTQLHKLLATG